MKNYLVLFLGFLFPGVVAASGTDARLYKVESSFGAEETVRRLQEALKAQDIPVFAVFDHKKNAEEAGLPLRPTTVVVFGSPKVGTKLMQENQEIAIELPLKILMWEDKNGKTQLAFPLMKPLGRMYGIQDNSVISNMEALLEKLVKKASGREVSETEEKRVLVNRE